MPQAKKLIEVALPLDAISEASAHEKHPGIGPHPRGLHHWWARRPNPSTRAVLFASLVDDPNDPNADSEYVEACRNLNYKGSHVETKGDSPRMRLFNFIEQLVQWKNSDNELIMNQARELIRLATGGKPPPVLDPFAGRGTIPLEAQRLGLEAYASDLNPVAVMINKAMIEIPPRFANKPPVNPRDRGQIGRDAWKGAAGLAADVRYYGEWMRERAFERIGHLYPKHNGETVIAWLWARTVISPNPAVNAPVPLVRSFVLSKKKGRECWAKPVVEGTRVRFEVTKGVPPENADGTMGRKFGGGRCIVSGEPISWDYVREEGKAGRMGTMLMAIVTEGHRGRSYYSPDRGHECCAVEAENMDYFKPSGKMPLKHRNFQPPVYGMYEFGDLFTPRQLVALTTFSDLVHEARDLATQDALRAGLADDEQPLREGGRGARAYGEAVSVYLAFAMDRCADFGNSLVRWVPSNEKAMSVGGRQALPMIWDYAETNILEPVVGGLPTCLHYVADCMETIPSRTSQGTAFQDDAANGLRHLENILVSTDPPYYDNISYADLSDFFYVWMRKNLRQVYPEVFATMLVPKETELIASTYRHGSKVAAKEHFEAGMFEAFENIRRIVARDYPLTVFYAFKQQDAGFVQGEAYNQIASTGWETMLASLLETGFTIVGTWPIRSEQRNRQNAMGANALASSIVLVCRPRPEDAPATSRRRFLDAMRAELPAAIATMKSGSIAPVDLAQASIGPGMAIYSRYSQIKHADGTAMTVREALNEIYIALEETLEGAIANLDRETRFALKYIEQRGFETGPYGDAEGFAVATNTSVASVALAGIVESRGGKVRLVNWREYNPGAYDPQQDKRPTVWEGTHHLIERLNGRGGEAGAAELYNRLPDEIAAAARDLAYRLYHICERKDWAEDALDYNALVSSWSEITRLATGQRASGTQPELALDPD